MADPDGSPEPAGRRFVFAVLWSGAALLVAGATCALVLSDDPRMLRLGLVAALWSALIGAFAATRQRQRVLTGEHRVAEVQQQYEAELEREVAARREFELETENERQRWGSGEVGAEVQALRVEVHTLRETLERVLGGELPGSAGENPAVRASWSPVRSLAERGEQSPFVEAEVFQPVSGQLAPSQLALGQPASGQLDPGQPAPGQLGPGQLGPGQLGPGQLGPGQPDPGQPAPGQSRPGQPTPDQPAPGQLTPVHPAPGQPAPVPAPAQPAPGQPASSWPPQVPLAPQAPPVPQGPVQQGSVQQGSPGQQGRVPSRHPAQPVPPAPGPQPAHPLHSWEAEQPGQRSRSERMRQQAVQAVGPSSSYGGAYRQSGTFAPVGDIGETEPEPGRSPVHHPGAHTEGTAVVDLLAAYGGSDNSADPGDTHGRRRRRS